MSTVEYTWRDSELRSPPLRALNWTGAQLARFGPELPSLRPSSVTAAAVKLAGSDDFGSDSYREPLEVYLRACEDEAELTTFGRLLDLQDAGRVRWPTASPSRTGRRSTPRCARAASSVPGSSSGCPGQEPACSPYSSGSTPWPGRSSSGRPPTPFLPRPWRKRRKTRASPETAKDLDGLMKLNPPLKAMHPFGATVAEECVAIFMYDVRALALETQAHVPSYARWLEKADMTSAYDAHRLALQTLQSRQPTERWILKTPNHLWHLDAMLAAYPDARVIWTHRDPGPVVTSLASLANAGQRVLTSRNDPRPTAEEWKRKCAFALRSAMAFDEQASDGWCQHIHYDDPDRRPRRHGP